MYMYVAHHYILRLRMEVSGQLHTSEAFPWKESSKYPLYSKNCELQTIPESIEEEKIISSLLGIELGLFGHANRCLNQGRGWAILIAVVVIGFFLHILQHVDQLLGNYHEITNYTNIYVLASKLSSLNRVLFIIFPPWESAFLAMISFLVDSGTWHKIMLREVRLNFIISISFQYLKLICLILSCSFERNVASRH
jgi:hypothetical protein